MSTTPSEPAFAFPSANTITTESTLSEASRALSARSTKPHAVIKIEETTNLMS